MTGRNDERAQSAALLREAAKLRDCATRAHSPQAAALLLGRAADLERMAALLELSET
jgi:hypothetical protein